MHKSLSTSVQASFTLLGILGLVHCSDGAPNRNEDTNGTPPIIHPIPTPDPDPSPLQPKESGDPTPDSSPIASTSPAPSSDPSADPSAPPSSSPSAEPSPEPTLPPNPNGGFRFRRHPQSGEWGCFNTQWDEGLNETTNWANLNMECAHILRNAQGELAPVRCGNGTQGICNFRDANFRGARIEVPFLLEKANLTNANFTMSQWKASFQCTDCNLTRSTFERAQFRVGLNLQASYHVRGSRGEQVPPMNFQNIYVIGESNFADIHFPFGANFSRSRLPNAFFMNLRTSTTLSIEHFSFLDADLTGATFRNVYGGGTANFQNTLLSGSVILDSDLREANFTRANLMNGKLCGTTFAGTDFRGADLSRTLLMGANISNIWWRGTEGYSSTNFRNMNIGSYLGNETNLCQRRNLLGCREILTQTLQQIEPGYPFTVRAQNARTCL